MWAAGKFISKPGFVLIFFFGWLVGWLVVGCCRCCCAHARGSVVDKATVSNMPAQCSPHRSGQFLWFCTLQDSNPQLTAQSPACYPLRHACTRKKDISSVLITICPYPLPQNMLLFVHGLPQNMAGPALVFFYLAVSQTRDFIGLKMLWICFLSSKNIKNLSVHKKCVIYAVSHRWNICRTMISRL